MAKRVLFMFAAILVFVAAIAFIKVRQVQAAIAQGSSYQPPPDAVTTMKAAIATWEPTLSAIGTVAPVQGVTISADLPGTIDTITFQSGDRVQAGAVLVKLDTRQEEAQLAAAAAKRDWAKISLDRVRGLVGKKVASQSELDQADAEYRQADASVGEIQATIAKKTIRAPFGGTLGIRAVNVGQYLDSGKAIVSLQSMDPIYANFSVPQQRLSDLRVGTEVRVATGDSADILATGRISAVDSVVDETTRNVQVQATFANPKGRLRPGMFVKADVALRAGSELIPVPASAISYAPYGDSIFVVEEMKKPDGTAYKGVRQQFVKLGPARGDQVAVIAGLKPGEEIVTSGVFKLRNGAPVQVNNDVQLESDASKKPEDN